MPQPKTLDETRLIQKRTFLPGLHMPHAQSRSRRNAPVRVVPFAGLHDRETSSPTSVAPARCYPLIQPTVEGVESVATRWKNGLVVAIPTECTYEACLAVRIPTRQNTVQSLLCFFNEWIQQIEQLRRISFDCNRLTTTPHHANDPYCVVTPGCELKRHPILREVCTPKLYALRPSDMEKNAVVHRFNESMEVLQRLAGKLWPGPVLIRLGISSNSPWTRTPFVVEAHTPRLDEENDPSNHAACFKHFVTLRCPRHPLAVKARKDVSSNENSLLVSLPIAHSTNVSKSEDAPLVFCTLARQVASRMAVLDGEDCREVFHVPTCEYGRPCASILWLDGRQRTVTVQSVSSIGSCDKAAVEAALRHPAVKSSGNRKERMLMQAILNKWKVLSCASGQDV